MSDALREAAQQALDALESLQGGCTDSGDGTVEAITVWCPEVIDALRAALSAPPPVVPAAPRPVAYLMREAAGRIELWLMVQDQQGALNPLGDTGPIRVPDDWREAVQKHEAQAAAPQAAHTAAAGLADHVPAGTEAEAATDAKLGLVMLPPIRVDRATHAALQQAAKARGVILPAIVRERLAPYTIPTAAHTAAAQAGPVPATGNLLRLLDDYIGTRKGGASSAEIERAEAALGLAIMAAEAPPAAAAPQAQAVRAPLTDAQLDAMRQSAAGLNFVTLREFRVIARAVEAALSAQQGE